MFTISEWSSAGCLIIVIMLWERCICGIAMHGINYFNCRVVEMLAGFALQPFLNDDVCVSSVCTFKKHTQMGRA